MENITPSQSPTNLSYDEGLDQCPPLLLNQPPSPPSSPPPPPLAPRQPILLYTQLHQPSNLSADRRQMGFDPNTLFNEFPFTLESQQEYIVVIQNSSFGYHKDHFIYPASINLAGGPLEINQQEDPFTLCLLLRHLSPDVNLTVAARTSLAFLIRNAHVSLRLCAVSPITEFCLRQDFNNIVSSAQDLPNCNYLTAYVPTESTTPAFELPPPVPACNNPLLLRRMRMIPKLSPLAMNNTPTE
jgi:hypothetical protein